MIYTKKQQQPCFISRLNQINYLLVIFYVNVGQIFSIRTLQRGEKMKETRKSSINCGFYISLNTQKQLGIKQIKSNQTLKKIFF